MRQAIKKELLEGIRTYKFLIILSVFMFFALMNPILNKMVLPQALMSQLDGISDEMLNQMVISSQRDCVRAYLQDVFEISTLVLVLALSSLVAGELRNKTFIFPRCSKKDFATLILAKLIVYGVFVIAVTVISAVVDYYYSGILFGTDLPGIVPILRSGILQGLYYVYVIGLVMLAGSFFAKPISAGLIALIPAYGTYIVSQLFKYDSYTPSGLLTEANMIAFNTSTNIVQPVIITFALIVILIILTIIRLETIELTRR